MSCLEESVFIIEVKDATWFDNNFGDAAMTDFIKELRKRGADD